MNGLILFRMIEARPVYAGGLASPPPDDPSAAGFDLYGGDVPLGYVTREAVEDLRSLDPSAVQVCTGHTCAETGRRVTGADEAREAAMASYYRAWGFDGEHASDMRAWPDWSSTQVLYYDGCEACPKLFRALPASARRWIAAHADAGHYDTLAEAFAEQRRQDAERAGSGRQRGPAGRSRRSRLHARLGALGVACHDAFAEAALSEAAGEAVRVRGFSALSAEQLAVVEARAARLVAHRSAPILPPDEADALSAEIFG